jgi:phosphatidylglycerophosphatase A
MPDKRPADTQPSTTTARRSRRLSAGDRVREALATCLWLGYSPFFPGTFGALLAIPFYLVSDRLLPSEPAQSIAIGVALVIWSAISVWLGGWSEEFFGKKDAGSFVADEVAGLLLTLLIFHLPGLPWLTLCWAFPLTRVIDMVKVPPANYLERLPRGWGILADDLMGSVYAGLLLHLAYWLQPTWFGA